MTAWFTFSSKFTIILFKTKSFSIKYQINEHTFRSYIYIMFKELIF